LIDDRFQHLKEVSMVQLGGCETIFAIFFVLLIIALWRVAPVIIKGQRAAAAKRERIRKQKEEQKKFNWPRQNVEIEDDPDDEDFMNNWKIF